MRGWWGLLALALAGAPVRPAWGCTLVEFPLEFMAREADAVFLGTFMRRDSVLEPIRIQVVRRFKGPEDKVFALAHPPSAPVEITGCDNLWDTRAGTTWLFFLSRWNEAYRIEDQLRLDETAKRVTLKRNSNYLSPALKNVCRLLDCPLDQVLATIRPFFHDRRRLAFIVLDPDGASTMGAIAPVGELSCRAHESRADDLWCWWRASLPKEWGPLTPSHDVLCWSQTSAELLCWRLDPRQRLRSRTAVRYRGTPD